MNSNCFNFLDMRNLQKQVKKAFFCQKMFWPFTAWTYCSSDLKIFANSRPRFSRSLEQFFLTVDQNNFGHKILFILKMIGHALKKTSARNTCNYRIEHKTMPWGPHISTVQYCFIWNLCSSTQWTTIFLTLCSIFSFVK